MTPPCFNRHLSYPDPLFFTPALPSIRVKDGDCHFEALLAEIENVSLFLPLPPTKLVYTLSYYTKQILAKTSTL
jgi:hypothetical protein